MNTIHYDPFEIGKKSIYETISERSKIIGWKWSNLEFLNSLTSQWFFVPAFLPISDFSDENIARIEKLFSDKLVAVRSSWIQEDHENWSMAGVFETHLNISWTHISQAIRDIHEHSFQKTGEKIPVVIQEMVNAEASWVAFSYDMDENKAYTVIQIGTGNGESLVSWKQTGETYKIHRYIDDQYIPDERLRALYLAVRHLSQNYYTRYIDVEFAFIQWSNIPYILQIRPVVRKGFGDHHEVHIPELMYRYSRMIAHLLSKSDDVFGNMIDINPEELVGNQPIVIQSFFNTIFPESSLREGRKFLGYGTSDNILGYALWHPYISLKNDLRLFLPKELPEEIVIAFEQYYTLFIKENPGEQSSLDSKHFPNTQEQLEFVLSKLSISEEQKTNTRWIFERFFWELQEKLINFDDETNSILSWIFEKISDLTNTPIHSFWDLIHIQNTRVNTEKLGELVKLIQECTYTFVIAARGAFYFNTQDSHIDELYFKAKKYESSIYQYMCEQGHKKMEFTSVEGFNFLKKMTSEYTIEWLESIWANTVFPEWNTVNFTSRFMVHRENIKYLFTRLFLILHNSIPDTKIAMRHTHFDRLIQNQMSGTQKIVWENRNECAKFEINDMLLFPGVMHRTNHMLFQKLNISDPHFIGKWLKRGKILFVKHVSELSGKNLEWKIICIENATPEIDIYLPKIEWILTKNGWPLAHITIRAREYGIPAVVGMGERFNALEKAESVEIDFTQKKLSIQ